MWIAWELRLKEVAWKSAKCNIQFEQTLIVWIKLDGNIYRWQLTIWYSMVNIWNSRVNIYKAGYFIVISNHFTSLIWSSVDCSLIILCWQHCPLNSLRNQYAFTHSTIIQIPNAVHKIASKIQHSFCRIMLRMTQSAGFLSIFFFNLKL